MKAVFSLLLCVVVASGEPLVKGPLGAIRGITETVLGADVESFLGIRYAKPPIGNLRFARPEAFTENADVDASEYGFSCPQPIIFPLQKFSNVTDSEDCLFLNVFRKAGTQKSDKKAVSIEASLVIAVAAGGLRFEIPDL